MPAPLDHALAALIALLWPLYEYFVAEPAAKRAIATGPAGTRGRFYGAVMAREWGLSLAVLVWWLVATRPFTTLGLRRSEGPGLWIGLLLAAAVVVLQVLQRRALTASAKARASVRRGLGRMEWLLPHDDAELRLFVSLSITAGICEELLFRGFLITYLQGFMPFTAAIFVQAVFFGFAHAYQGPRGIVSTGLVGAAMGGLYALTGSLWVPMLVHAAIDIGSGVLVHRALSEPAPPAEVAPA